MDDTTFSKRFRNSDLSTLQIALTLGIPQSTARRWRNGNSLPPAEVRAGLVHALDVREGKLEGVNGPMPTFF